MTSVPSQFTFLEGYPALRLEDACDRTALKWSNISVVGMGGALVLRLHLSINDRLSSAGGVERKDGVLTIDNQSLL
jgi:hypothetical protein